MKPQAEHRPLCTIELIAEGRAGRCPGEPCAFWERGCVLDRIEAELAWRPEVARLLLELRRALEAGRALEVEHARSRLARALVTDERAPLPAFADHESDPARGAGPEPDRDPPLEPESPSEGRGRRRAREC